MANITNFKIHNNSNGRLANQDVLVFLTPKTTAQHWTYAAWQVLNPGEGGMSPFSMVNTISAQMFNEENGYLSNRMDVDAGSMLECINANNLLPTLQALRDPGVGLPTAGPTQAGVRNSTKNPGFAPKARWFVNGNLTCQSLAPVWAGGTLSAFELDLVLYFAVGYEQVGPNYTYDQVTAQQPFHFTPAVNNVDVSLTFDEGSKTFQWTFVST